MTPQNSLEHIRHFFYQTLNDPSFPACRIVNGVLVFLIIFSITVIPLHFLPNMEWAQGHLYLFDQVAVTIFTVEYFLRIWAARRPLQYLLSWWGLIDFIAIAPFYLAQFGILDSFEIFLVLRALRILKLTKIYEVGRHAMVEHAGSHHGGILLIPGERIERIVQKHSLVFLISLVFPLIFTSLGLIILVFLQANPLAIAFSTLFFILAIVFFIKAWLDYNYDVIYITDRRIILQNRELFGTICNDVAYEAIANVVPNNVGILQFALGFGDIQIETSSAQGSLLFENAPKPHDVVQHIAYNRERFLAAKAGSIVPNIADVISTNKDEE